jgi:hypothetical protein
MPLSLSFSSSYYLQISQNSSFPQLSTYQTLTRAVFTFHLNPVDWIVSLPRTYDHISCAVLLVLVVRDIFSK